MRQTLPESFYAEFAHSGIGRDQRHVFHDRLRRKEPVEGITMVAWQQAGPDGLGRRQIDGREPFGGHQFGKTSSEDFGFEPFAEPYLV